MAIDWYNFVRDICAQYFTANPVVIGGPGIEVENDESIIGGVGRRDIGCLEELSA